LDRRPEVTAETHAKQGSTERAGRARWSGVTTLPEHGYVWIEEKPRRHRWAMRRWVITARWPGGTETFDVPGHGLAEDLAEQARAQLEDGRKPDLAGLYDDLIAW
jgi:hypothetical protein